MNSIIKPLFLQIPWWSPWCPKLGKPVWALSFPRYLIGDTADPNISYILKQGLLWPLCYHFRYKQWLYNIDTWPKRSGSICFHGNPPKSGETERPAVAPNLKASNLARFPHSGPAYRLITILNLNLDPLLWTPNHYQPHGINPLFTEVPLLCPFGFGVWGAVGATSGHNHAVTHHILILSHSWRSISMVSWSSSWLTIIDHQPSWPPWICYQWSLAWAINQPW